uniref:YDG domain-containing protein n=1 Tax=Lactuca sativa TaxID=4236 RepID=A0A9R1UDV4_LACSA|nr:hypothetical protein LSAT_V11C900482250 [Lactuca sativa]
MLRFLRICDSDEKPTLGYVYEGMYRAKKEIKKLFRNNIELYTHYINIIKNQWDRMWWWGGGGEGGMDMIERYNSIGTMDGLTLTDQLKLFHEHECSFCRKLAFASRNTTRPDEWWKLHGGDAPELQKFMLKLINLVFKPNPHGSKLV